MLIIKDKKQPSDGSEPKKMVGTTFSGGDSESVGMMPKNGGSAKSDIERLVDGPTPDLSDLDELDEMIQNRPFTLLIRDAFDKQKEGILNLMGHWLLIGLPGIVNIYRSWPFLKTGWRKVCYCTAIRYCENLHGVYANFFLALLLVGLSSALYCILFARVLELRNARYMILLLLALAVSFYVQENLTVGWGQMLKSLDMK